MKYPAIVRLWEHAWAEFVPFVQFDVEIRKIVCTTNAIESVNARIRKAVRARGRDANPDREGEERTTQNFPERDPFWGFGQGTSMTHLYVVPGRTVLTPHGPISPLGAH